MSKHYRRCTVFPFPQQEFLFHIIVNHRKRENAQFALVRSSGSGTIPKAGNGKSGGAPDRDTAKPETRLMRGSLRQGCLFCMGYPPLCQWQVRAAPLPARSGSPSHAGAAIPEQRDKQKQKAAESIGLPVLSLFYPIFPDDFWQLKMRLPD